MGNNNDLNNNDYKKYQKKSFLRRLPFGVKATFIKYWFYGALYFFCFMGLGFYVRNENLVLATGLIGGVLFDIALYNIYILIAETREEASKWWIFKSKKFYSIFVNVLVITGLLFVYYYIVVPINKAKPSSLDWLFQEPLSSALLLTTIDTAFVWLKNVTIMFIKKLFKREPTKDNINEAYIKILEVTPVSVSFEINNKDIYYASKPYNVFLNNELILKKVTTNVLTIYDLKPDSQYHLTINRQNATFTTPKIYKFYKVFEGNDIQKVIDTADQYSLIIVNSGTYHIKSLILKNNLVLYLRKGVKLISSDLEKDYPIIPAFNSQDEIYGNYKGEAKKMRQSIIHLDHLKNVKIVGEGVIESKFPTKLDSKIAPPHLVFINHSSNVSLIGLTLNNSPQWMVHPFFSDDINLINLKIRNSKDVPLVDGITPQCSSKINIIGCQFANLKKGVAIKSGQKEIAKKYQTPSSNILIRNCFMEDSNSAVCFGSEASAGIHAVNISRSYLINLDNAFIFNTKRGSGVNMVIKNVNVENIKMDNVLVPIVMNMFYSVHPKEENERVLAKRIIPIDNETPYFNNFVFKNLEVKNFEYACGYFYGLPEKYIYEIKIVDSSFTPKEVCQSARPIEVDDVNQCSKRGFIAKNVRSLELKNVKLNNIMGDRVEVTKVSELIDR